MKSNKQVKAMMIEMYYSAFERESEKNNHNSKRWNWTFDRMRLCECNFKREKLRHPELSLISVDGNGDLIATAKG